MAKDSVVSTWSRVAAAGIVGVLVAGGLTLVLVLVSITDPANTAAPAYLPLAWSAVAVVTLVVLIAFLVTRVDIRTSPGFAWLVGGLSFAASFLPWWGLAGNNVDLGTLIYRGLRVPPSIMQFWDLSLVLTSIDCARFGFDIYQDNNGCMQDASIYAPGMVWLQYVPGRIFSESHVQFLGVAMIIISSLVLAWLARQSVGLGRIVLLVAAVGGPWLLLLERGNVDAVLLWAAALVVLLVRRWDNLAVWSVAAVVVWLVGTWKYYPFALGVMLLPVLRLRRGWIVLVGFVAAAIGFVLFTWRNVVFSLGSNTNMIDYGDYAVLGRVPVVARMLGTDVAADGWQFGDLLLLMLAVLAGVVGFAVGRLAGARRPWMAMLAAGGAALYLSSVLIAGFGYAYKGTFLLLAVPALSRLPSSRMRIVAGSGLAGLLFVGVQSVVVWNTVMATVAGLTAAAFALGFALAAFAAVLLERRGSLSPHP